MNPSSPLSLEEIVQREMNRLRGKLLGAIESYTLPQRQEAGIKTVVKTFSYEAEASIKEAVRNQ